jgi:hypothetical protein
MISGHTENTGGSGARAASPNFAKPITAHNLFARIAEIVERPRLSWCDSYFGPDRRRHQNDDYTGPWRRKDDYQDAEVR